MDKAIPDPAPPLADDELCGYVAIAPNPTRILEDFTPLWRSLDLRLARTFWGARGVTAFLDGDVPYGATSGGRLADDAARTLLTRLEEAGVDGPVRLLEIGAGSGIFAKILLDRLAELSPEVYAATRFVITDGAEAMLEGMGDLGLMEAHGGRVALVRIDATAPIAPQLEAAGEAATGYHGVFANYLLDSLPFAIRALRGDKAWEMELRASLDDAVDLARYFDGDLADLRAALTVLEDAPDSRLATLHRALVLDARYAPSTREAAPYPETLPPVEPETPEALTTVTLDNFGAVALLDQLVEALDPNGALLITDYGRSVEPEPGEPLEYQRFGGSAAVGLNFAQIDRWAEARDGVWLAKPTEDPDSLMTRAISRAPSEALSVAMEALCSATRIDALNTPLEKARDLAKSHCYEAARWRYEEGLRLQPCNWNVLEEIATFLITIAGDADGGLAMVTRALELNPAAPGAYRLLGRALWDKGERKKAEIAYRQALELSPANGSLRIDLAEALLAGRRHREALVIIAEGLALDEACDHRDDMIDIQNQILQDHSLQARDELVRSVNRLRRHRALPGGSAAESIEDP